MEKVYLVEWIDNCEYEVYSNLGKAMSRILKMYAEWAKTISGLTANEVLADLKNLSENNYIEDFVCLYEKEVK